MTKRIALTPKASLDIDELFAYIAQNNFEVALQFFDATRETLAQIAKMPGIGSVYPLASPRLQGLRKWKVKGFKNYLIFYLEQEDYIQIIRIIYASQDLPNILEADEGE